MAMGAANKQRTTNRLSSCDELVAWEHDNARSKVGGRSSDRAIDSLLALREPFRLPCPQTEGLGRSLAKLLGSDLAIPDFTALAKLAAKLGVSLDVVQATGPPDVVVASNGPTV